VIFIYTVILDFFCEIGLTKKFFFQIINYFFVLRVDKPLALVYNIYISIPLSRYGSAMVSTGVVKYDKRSAPDNRVKMSKLK